jgi:hypothetical protein
MISLKIFTAYIAILLVFSYRIANATHEIFTISGFNVLYIVLFTFVIVLHLKSRNKNIVQFDKKILLLLASLILSYIGLLVYPHSQGAYLEYLKALIHTMLLFGFFISLYYIGFYNLKNAYIKLLALFAIYGVYQFLGFFIDLPLSEPTGVRTKFIGDLHIRATSLFDEPSFYAPFLLYGLVLAYLDKKRNYFILFFISIIITFSVGGYIGLLLLILILFLKKYSFKSIKTYFLILLLSGMVSILFINSPIYERIVHEKISFEEGNSTSTEKRLSAALMFLNVWDDVPVTLVFGAGAGTYAVLSEKYNVYGRASNNLFGDILVEQGLMGLMAYLIVVYGRFYFHSRKSFPVRLIFTVLIIESLFKGAFMQPAFYFILFLMIMYLKENKRDKVK